MANLTARQRRLYIHLAKIWKNVPVYDQNDVQTGEIWQVVADAVPCWWEMSINADEVHPFGRIAFDSLLTLDKVYFAVDQQVESDYILANQTLNQDGSQSENYGGFWRVRGPARDFSSNRRHAGRREVLAYREKTPPKGVSV
jgi:hypothetical protein